MKKSNTTVNILLNIALLIIFSVLFFLTSNEWILTGLIVLLIILALKIEYHKREWLLLLIGIICGVILEVGGDAIYKLQYWTYGSFFGIPLWLPLFWGYAFILINRIGKVVVK